MPDLFVANMVAQKGVKSLFNRRPIRYGALETCLDRLARFANWEDRLTGQKTIPVHMPRIGCGLAGGKWELVEPLVAGTLCRQGIDVYVYDLPK